MQFVIDVDRDRYAGISIMKVLYLSTIFVVLFVRIIVRAQEQPRFRYFKNFAADLAELVSTISLPSNGVTNFFARAITRGQNEVFANTGGIIGRERRGGGPILSNNPEEIRFLLYSNKTNPGARHELKLERWSNSSSIVSELRVPKDSHVKILIYGYNGTIQDFFPEALKNAYLSSTSHIVIMVDWKSLSVPKGTFSAAFYYPAVADNVPRVAARVFQLIDFLLERQIIVGLEQIHLIGFSLGAHIAGYAGQLTLKKFNKKVQRITALDPAGLFFQGTREDMRLDHNDAEFVDVVHSSFLGMFPPFGHVDFYPNGGQVHPHCNNFRFDTWTECNHQAANMFYERSIMNRDVKACKCSSYRDFRDHCKFICPDTITFGEHVPQGARGKFFLDYDLSVSDDDEDEDDR